MDFIASVSVRYSNETGHRAVFYLKSGSLRFAIPENTGPFSRLVEMIGAARYHTGWAVALEHCDVQRIGPMRVDEVEELRRYEVRP